MTRPDRDDFDDLLAWALRQPDTGDVPAAEPTEDCPVGALLAGVGLTADQLHHVQTCPFCSRLAAAQDPQLLDQPPLAAGPDPLPPLRSIAGGRPVASAEVSSSVLPLVAGTASLPLAAGTTSFHARFETPDGVVSCEVVTDDEGAMVAVVTARGENLEGHYVRMRWQFVDRATATGQAAEALGPARTPKKLALCLIPLRWSADGEWTGWVRLSDADWKVGDRIAVELSAPLVPRALADEEPGVIEASVSQAGGGTVETWRELARRLPNASQRQIEPWLR